MIFHKYFFILSLCKKKAPKYKFNPFSTKCYTSIPPENIRKPKVMFSGGIEVKTWPKMG